MEITPQEALDCFASDDLIGIGMEADAVRRALHPDNIVTYAVPRTLALHQSREDLSAAIEALARAGDTTVCLSLNAFGEDATVSLSEAEETLAAIRQRFPSLRLCALSTASVLALSEGIGPGLQQTLSRLHAAGLDAISGDDLCAVAVESSASTLESTVASSGLIDRAQWLKVHRLAHHAGLTSTAGLVFGLGESSQDRADCLFAIRALQQETSGFTAFSLLRPEAATTSHLEPPTAVEYLRTLAIARIALDNIPSIESNSLAHGLKVTQMALRFGANDAGALGPGDTPSPAAFTEEDLRRVIRDAGFTPVERDPLYRTLFLNN